MTSGITFLHGQHNPQCVATVDKRFSYHALQFMTRGQVKLRYDQVDHLLDDAWAWPCHPGPHVFFHEWPRARPWDHRYIAFAGPLATQWEDDGVWLPAPQRLPAGGRVERLVGWFDELLEQVHRPERFGQRIAANLLERILLDLAEDRRSVRAPCQPRWVGQVQQVLGRFEGTEPDYDALADEHGMALSTLRRRFRESTGTSLHDYRLNCRIAQAKRALGDPDLPIKKIAEQLGYQDTFYFSRQFRQRAGVSPAVFRRSRQG